MKYIKYDGLLLKQNYNNMLDVAENYYELKISSERTYACEWDEYIEQGMAYFDVSGELVPAHLDGLTYIIEEVVQLPILSEDEKLMEVY